MSKQHSVLVIDDADTAIGDIARRPAHERAATNLHGVTAKNANNKAPAMAYKYASSDETLDTTIKMTVSKRYRETPFISTSSTIFSAPKMDSMLPSK